MASFRKRSGRWQARVTRKGQPDLVKTFNTKEDAQKWARAIEREIDTGSFMPGWAQCNFTVGLVCLVIMRAKV
jgi:hypothetical protein